MTRILALSLADIKNIFREQILYVMFIIAPVMQFLLARYVVPLAGDYFPPLKPYYFLLLLLFILQVVNGIAFVISSIMLDERDEEVLTALRTLPMSTWFFLGYRLLFAMTIAFLFGLVMIKGTGLVAVSWPVSLAMAFLFSLETPIVLLIMTTFSRNKVEGLAVYKGINLVLLLPAASFFIPPPYEYFMSPIPTHWTFQVFDLLLSGESPGGLWVAAVVFHLVVIGVLAEFFRRRVF